MLQCLIVILDLDIVETSSNNARLEDLPWDMLSKIALYYFSTNFKSTVIYI